MADVTVTTRSKTVNSVEFFIPGGRVLQVMRADGHDPPTRTPDALYFEERDGAKGIVIIYRDVIHN